MKLSVKVLRQKIQANLTSAEFVLKGSPENPYFLGVKKTYNTVLALLDSQEKELREMMPTYEYCRKVPPMLAVRKLVKEILG